MSGNDELPHVVIRSHGINVNSSSRRVQRRNQITPPKLTTVCLFPIGENGGNSENSSENVEDKMTQLMERWKLLHNEQSIHTAKLRKLAVKKQILQREGYILRDKVLADLRTEIKAESERRKILEEKVSHLETRIASFAE